MLYVRARSPATKAPRHYDSGFTIRRLGLRFRASGRGARLWSGLSRRGGGGFSYGVRGPSRGRGRGWSARRLFAWIGHGLFSGAPSVGIFFYFGFWPFSAGRTGRCVNHFVLELQNLANYELESLLLIDRHHVAAHHNIVLDGLEVGEFEEETGQI